ncbi:MAG: hypothetical protein HY556_10915 [Euryarchaeota archaeon]|nr:hypothetical protein [Euryarchaeota archaeon]
MKSLILLKAKQSKWAEVVAHLRTVGGLTSYEPVFGSVDAVLEAEASNLADLERITEQVKDHPAVESAEVLAGLGIEYERGRPD